MQLSAFVDGELPENEAELLLRRVSQDAGLRQQVAEYLALGRLIRSEAGLAATDRLHARVAAEIDHRAVGTSAASSSRRLPGLRPLAGIAIAAMVALAAVFALQQPSIDSEQPAQTQIQVADDAVPDTAAGVPSLDAQLERQRELFRKHAEAFSQFGENGMNSRVVDLRFSEDIESPADDADSADDKGEEAAQP